VRGATLAYRARGENSMTIGRREGAISKVPIKRGNRKLKLRALRKGRIRPGALKWGPLKAATEKGSSKGNFFPHKKPAPVGGVRGGFGVFRVGPDTEQGEPTGIKRGKPKPEEKVRTQVP